MTGLNMLEKARDVLKKSSCSEEIAAPKNYFVEVITLKKYEELASPKKKAAMRKWQHMREGELLFEKRPILNQ